MSHTVIRHRPTIVIKGRGFASKSLSWSYILSPCRSRRKPTSLHKFIMRSFLLAGGLLLAGASMIFAAPVGSLEVRLDSRHTSSHRITDYRLIFFFKPRSPPHGTQHPPATNPAHAHVVCVFERRKLQKLIHSCLGRNATHGKPKQCNDHG